MQQEKVRVKRSGIALITTLMVMALLLTLIGAFITVEKSASRLTGNALQRRSAQDGCLSALNVAWNYLEDDPDWGATGHFPALTARTYPATHPTLRLEQKLVGGDKVLVGSLHPDGAFDAPDAVTFELTIHNNIRSRTVLVSGLLPVPARSIRLICVAKVGSSVRRMDTILRQVPLSYDSLAARHAASVLTGPGGLVRMESRDPYVNRIRAGSDLELPQAADVQFLGHGSADTGTLKLNGALQTTETQLNAANDASGGTYSIGQGPPKIPQFVGDNFKLPDAPDKVTDVRSGTYSFGGLPHVEWKEHEIDYQKTTPGANPGDPDVVENKEAHRYQKLVSTYDQLVDAEGRIWVAAEARANSLQKFPANDPPASASEAEATGYGFPAPQGQAGFGADGSPVTPDHQDSDIYEIYPGLWANVVTAQMAIRSGYRVQADNQFTVSADGDRLPEMLFGYKFSPGGVATQESLDQGLEAALNDPNLYMAALVAGGNVDIPGGVIGYGSMIAGGDMTLKASAGLRAAPQLGVVVKARSLTINPATEPEPQLPGEPVSTDYPVFQEAISAFAGGNWAQFDNWLSQAAPARLTTTQSMKVTLLSQPPATYWSQLNTELHTNFPVPVFGPGWSGSATLEQYIRLKEYIQTLASGYNHGAGDPSWIDMTKHAVDAEQRLSNTVSTMAQWAKSYKKSLQAYLANPAPQVPDMFYQGLLYADQNLTINADGKSFRLEGSAIAGGNASILGARSVELVYDRALVDDQMKTNHATPDGSTTHLRLEKIFFTIQ